MASKMIKTEMRRRKQPETRICNQSKTFEVALIAPLVKPLKVSTLE